MPAHGLQGGDFADREMGYPIDRAIWFERDSRLATGLFVGSLYLFGAAGNFWATRGRHPGWMLMAAALVLIAIGLERPG